jgi:hypothetical protein
MNNLNYQVSLTMAEDTVHDLINSGYYLYAFHAVQSSDKAGRPLVWIRVESYSVTTVIGWTEMYQAFTSQSKTIKGQIHAGFFASITDGQILRVNEGGTGVVTDGGRPATISILNSTTTQFVCGISLKGALTCAFPLYGENEQVITPTAKVLLIFSTQRIAIGTVIEYISDPRGSQYQGLDSLAAISPGILIDLCASHQREVSFDINDGWTWGGGAWAQVVPANTNLVPLLIEPST